MYLSINLSQRDIINLSLFDKDYYYQKNYTGQNRELLICVDKILKLKKINIKDINGIICIVGHGGFTSTRLAVVIGNTLAYTLQIPIIAINEPTPDKEYLQKLIPKIKKQPIGQLILASYSGEPNIGK